MTSDLSVFLPGGSTGILLLHDLGSMVPEARALAQGFARAGFSVYCPALAESEGGHGGAEWSSMDAVVEAERAMSRLGAHCADVVVAGAGYGAMLALKVAQHNAGAVRALVLLDPRSSVLPFSSRLAGALTGRLPQRWLVPFAAWMRRLPRMGRRTPADGSAGGSAECAPRSRPRPPTAILRDLAVLLDGARHALPSVMQPALLFHHRVNRRGGEGPNLLQRRLGGRVESVMLDDSGPSDAHGRVAEGVVERSARFVAAVLEEIETKRGNQLRRERMARRSNAA